MFEVQEALDAQKEEFARREDAFRRREEALRKKDLELQEVSSLRRNEERMLSRRGAHAFATCLIARLRHLRHLTVPNPRACRA